MIPGVLVNNPVRAGTVTDLRPNLLGLNSQKSRTMLPCLNAALPNGPSVEKKPELARRDLHRASDSRDRSDLVSAMTSVQPVQRSVDSSAQPAVSRSSGFGR